MSTPPSALPVCASTAGLLGGDAGSSALDRLPAVLDSRIACLSALLDLVRGGVATTRPELERLTGLGRKVIAQRLVELTVTGLIDDGSLGPSTGGRAPRQLRFVAEAGLVLVAHFGATGMSAGITDLAGRVLSRIHRDHDIALGPEAALRLMLELWDDRLAAVAVDRPAARDQVWGVGVGVPGPVEFATGRSVSPPIMPGWDDFPLRERIQDHWSVPVWVDNDVNAMALGELRAGTARGRADFVYVKLGTGIGAGLVARGRLLRGAQGGAGDIGHVPVREHLGMTCRCGRIDCLEAVAGGGALVLEAQAAVQGGASPILSRLLERDGRLTVRSLTEAARHGDLVATALLRTSGQHVGEMLASLVNTLNPALIVLGGHIAESDDLVLASVRQAVYERSLPLATRDLIITRSMDSDVVGITGAAFTVIDELFAPDLLDRWIDTRRPGPDLHEPGNTAASAQCAHADGAMPRAVPVLR